MFIEQCLQMIAFLTVFVNRIVIAKAMGGVTFSKKFGCLHLRKNFRVKKDTADDCDVKEMLREKKERGTKLFILRWRTQSHREGHKKRGDDHRTHRHTL